ncbi:breast carcinoma amplified sequence 2 [Vararia minispora EC-137]|uniref:Breast carcinoma amplified sequence 2 n=1 Tax=Vararia minispora EC-137 TaxID=1314806 RepID=A0ACB8QTK1_9AGAM|nr:breast carcinoma amplified sequence 2 [Vararia minispora EC-137]
MSTETTDVDASQSIPTFFDALPYYDDDLERFPILRERVQHEIAVEVQKLQQVHGDRLHPHVPPDLDLFKEHALLADEMKRVEEGHKLDAIDRIRYTLPVPGEGASEGEWKAALDNARTQLEHQRIRHNNLALLSQYGANAWKVHNYMLEADAKKAAQMLEAMKEETTSVNRDRKNAQMRIGNELTSLEKRWQELIGGVLQIEMANVAMELEVQRLNRRETELSRAL